MFSSRTSVQATAQSFLARASSLSGAGRARQDRIYRAGVSGLRPSVPTDAATREDAARRRMSRKAWAYIAGGAGEGRTISANHEAFDRFRLVPRVAHGFRERDLTVTLFGQRYRSPVLLAPIGAAALVDPDADLSAGRAASATGIPMIISSQGCSPLEETAAAARAGGPGQAGSPPGHWFQLYWSTDEQLVDSFIDRAEASGAGALVVTLDTTVLGWRPQDLNLGSLPFSRGQGIAQYTSDPRFRDIVRDRIAAATDNRSGGGVRVTPAAVASLLSIVRNHPGSTLRNLLSPEPRASVETFLGIYSNPGLDWDMLATLRDRTTLPLVFKGILHPEDAARAFDIGADAVIVSNHGGRQVDGSISSLDALVEIRRHLGPDPTLLLDSGIRTGRDVAVALALGADAVLLGRQWLYGLALAGQHGVEEVLQNILAELDLTMALTGAADVPGLRRLDVRGAE